MHRISISNAKCIDIFELIFVFITQVGDIHASKSPAETTQNQQQSSQLLDTSEAPPPPPSSQMTSFTSDLNTSLDTNSSSNYTNFTKNDYEPFKYAAQDQLAKKDDPLALPKEVTPLPEATIDPSANSNSGAKLNISQPIKVLTNPNKDLHANHRTNYAYNYNIHQNNSNNNTLNYRGFSRIRKKSDNAKQLFYVKLKFAEGEFSGEGNTLQLAKHDAASKALAHFSEADNFLKAKALSASVSAQNKNVKAYRPPQFYKQQQHQQQKQRDETG